MSEWALVNTLNAKDGGGDEDEEEEGEEAGAVFVFLSRAIFPSGAVRCGVVWCGVVRCGVVRCGVVWCGVVWCRDYNHVLVDR